MWPPSRSRTTMLLIRSLMSAAGNDRSIRASPLTAPSRRKCPTPLENSSTRLTGSPAARGSSSKPFSAGRAPTPDTNATSPTTPRTPALTPASSHFLIVALLRERENRYPGLYPWCHFNETTCDTRKIEGDDGDRRVAGAG